MQDFKQKGNMEQEIKKLEQARIHILEQVLAQEVELDQKAQTRKARRERH